MLEMIPYFRLIGEERVQQEEAVDGFVGGIQRSPHIDVHVGMLVRVD